MRILSLALMFLSFSAMAAPDCGLSLSLGNATIQATNTQQVIQQDFQVTRNHPNNNRCSNYVLYFSKGRANSYQRSAYNTLNQPYLYNLHSNINLSGILKDRNDAVAINEVVTGGTPNNGGTYNGSFFIAVTPTSLNPYAGTFTDNIQVNLFRASDVNDQNLEAVYTFNVTIGIPTTINLSLVDEGGVFNPASTSKVMDFGDFVQNQEMGADLMVSSNTPYQIRFSSANNGVMKNLADSVNYQLKVNQTVINMQGSASAPVIVATSGTSSVAAGDRYNIRVKITDAPDSKSAGLYQDSITITAIAN